MTIKKKQGLNEITRYNLYTSAAIQGAPAAGYSSGQAIQAIKEVAAETLPRGYDIGWEGLAYDEARKGNVAVYIFLIVVVFVYLVLVGQYESFILPLAVILSLPVGHLRLLLVPAGHGVGQRRLRPDRSGHAGRSAGQERDPDRRIRGAAAAGGRVASRRRPSKAANCASGRFMMTSFAFIAGLIPLVVATGPGAIGNRTIGTTAVGGMLLGTVIGVLVIPGLYYLFGRLDGGRKLLKDETHAPLSESPDHSGRPPGDGSTSRYAASTLLHAQYARRPLATCRPIPMIRSHRTRDGHIDGHPEQRLLRKHVHQNPPSAGIRDRHLDHPLVPGGAGDQDPADRPVPQHRAADRDGHDLLSRRQRQCPGRIRADPARAIDQRRPEHALHHLLAIQRRRGGDHDLLRAGHGPEHQRRERAKPGQHRAVPAPAAGGPRGDPRHARSCRAC